MAPEIMEEPYVLLSTPKPFGGPDSKAQAAPVHRYTPLAVRQRNEVAVAIDGEGVYIYDISTPRLITSYAVSPQIQFLCKPCSIVRKKSSTLAERLTYAAVRQKENKQVSLLCFVEDLGRQSANARSTSAVVKQEHVFADRDISVHDIIISAGQSASEDSFNVLVVHDKSIIQSFSGDLQSINWTYTWPKAEQANLLTRFEYASLTSARELKSGLLATAYEAAAAVSSWTADETADNVLVLVHRRPQPGTRRRWTVSLLRVPQTADQRVAVHDVQLISTPKNADIDAEAPAVFNIQVSSGYIFAQISKTLLQWNMRDARPRAQMNSSDITSFLPLGYAELLVSKDTKCSILDLEWQTTQGEVSASTKVESAPRTGSKRSRDAGLTNFDGSEFVDYFTGASVAVALRAGSLFAIPITSGKPNKRLRTQPRTLAETVGKAATQGSKSDGTKTLPESFVSTVRTLVQENKVVELEEYLAKDLDLSYEKLVRGEEEYKGKRVFADSDENKDNNEVCMWSMPVEISSIIRRTDWEKANFVFGEIFPKGQGPRFYSPSIYEWLALTGFFSTGLDHGVSSSGRTSTVEVVKSLADADPSLSLLNDFLGWPYQLNLDAVVTSLDVAIESLDQPSHNDEQLTNGLTNGDATTEEERTVETASRAAEEDLALAIVSLNDGMAIRGFLLRSIFDRLSTFDDAQITKAFRAHLSPRKLVFLINLLRIELADGGWTTRYTDYVEDEDEEMTGETADHSIKIIVKLLNTAIDAVGPTGWNVNLKADKQLNSDEMLLVLRAEITAALEGSQEFEALGAALLDFSKYCTEAKPVIKQTQKRREVDPINNPGFVRDDRQDALLPLGAKAEVLELTRPHKAGKVLPKSKGAIGQELSMRVGKYSLDRIRV